MGEAKGFMLTETDFLSDSDLSSPANINAKPMTTFISLLQTEITKMNQFNDPQGIYTLCLACSAH